MGIFIQKNAKVTGLLFKLTNSTYPVFFYGQAKGMKRPRAIRKQQFEAPYVFSAVCPTEGKALALVIPVANVEIMQHLIAI